MSEHENRREVGPAWHWTTSTSQSGDPSESWRIPEVPPPRAYRFAAPRPNYILHLVLFLASILSTALIGGILYSVSIMAILLAHEMGHYLMARRYRVPATLPYFIPMPLSIFGTMGAVIRMASLGADRKALFDIGVAGPIAGLVLAVPACLIGLSMSDVVEMASLREGYVNLGSSIFFQWLSDIFFPSVPEGHDVRLHPVAFAGWAGLFVTALNLLPIGQLDGGHAAYALLGRRAHGLALVAAAGFVGLAVFVSPQWLFLAALLFVFGLRHPPTADDTVPIGPGRRALGLVLLGVFVLSFTPRPFSP
jgi:membrane-associated protease RseP (regulator of RpoE activity)